MNKNKIVSAVSYISYVYGNLDSVVNHSTPDSYDITMKIVGESINKLQYALSRLKEVLDE